MPPYAIRQGGMGCICMRFGRDPPARRRRAGPANGIRRMGTDQKGGGAAPFGTHGEPAAGGEIVIPACFHADYGGQCASAFLAGGEPLLHDPEHGARLRHADLYEAIGIETESGQPRRVDDALLETAMGRNRAQDETRSDAERAGGQSQGETERGGEIAMAGGHAFVQRAECQPAIGQARIEFVRAQRDRRTRGRDDPFALVDVAPQRRQTGTFRPIPFNPAFGRPGIGSLMAAGKARFGKGSHGTCPLPSRAATARRHILPRGRKGRMISGQGCMWQVVLHAPS